MAVTLRPTRWGIGLVSGLFFAFAVLGAYIAWQGQPFGWLFTAFGLALGGVCIGGAWAWLRLEDDAVAQWAPFSRRQRWRFHATQIVAWSEVDMETAHWLAMKPSDRETVDWQQPALIEVKRSYLLFQLRDTGEIVLIGPWCTWTRRREVVRDWLQEHVGEPRTGGDALHWQIDRKRDRRCWIKPPHPDEPRPERRAS